MDKTATVTEKKIQRMELLYEKFYNRLYLYAHTFLFDEDEAKDVVGDVFQMIWEDWSHDCGRYDEPTVSFLYVTTPTGVLTVCAVPKPATITYRSS